MKGWDSKAIDPKLMERINKSDAKANQNRIASTFANLEPNTANAPVAEKEVEGHDTPYSINIHSIRHRLCDSDGISAKAAIDGLVYAGILPNDSPQFVKEVSYSQEKGDPEKTIITLTWE